MLDLELVKKYKKEFDHLVNGGSIWYRYRIIEGSEGNIGMTVWYLSNGVDTEWEEDATDYWSRPYTDLQVVIDDKYTEFRKAIHEGRVIQVDKALFYDEDFDGLDSDGSYWIDITTSNPIFGLQPHCYRIKPEEPKFEVGDWVTNSETNETYQAVEEDLEYECTLWKPIQGEFCVMYNTDTVSQFYTVVRYNYFSEIVERHYSEYGVHYTNVAPIEF